MLKSHEKFHSANGKRLVLVAEDEEINRDLLNMVLKDDYEVIFAKDGQQAYQLIREHQNRLSVILLDLIMPKMDGLELLEKLKDDHALQLIPVIVLTSDQESEIKALTLGAADFIQKPYPAPGVILARLRRTIELFEDRLTIQTTERDPLTNLYNREFFYHYAELFDQYHETLEMDALIIDIYHFRVINERFGNTYGDEILRRIGLKIREMVSDTGGIVCRREADTFMVYCPHGKNYKKILESASEGINEEDKTVNRVRLRMGVYSNVDRSIPIERRFDRAKMAADMIRNSYTKSIEIYDHKLHEKEIFEQQLIEDFAQALREKQFIIYYQPKFDIRPDTPILASAEALIRWNHPQFGFISPGQFIPLFEENGLIQELDHYVWNSVARQIRQWKDQHHYTVPVSVNVSRVNMYDPHLVDNLLQTLAENNLSPDDLPLEVTESAYTKDSEQIIATVNYLRSCGFRIEMDDFGNGYSSLNMISTLPIDALKLDMEFVQNAFKKRTDTRMLEIIVDIADYLSVPVIAEGVETEEQMEALKAIGCDIVQGYYFSRPIPSDQFEQFLLQRAQLGDETSVFARSDSIQRKNSAFGKIANALSNQYESIYYVDTHNDHYVEFSAEGQREEIKIDKSGKHFFSDIQATFRRLVHPDDQEEMLKRFSKQNLYTDLEHGHPLSLTYRMIINGEPLFYNIKAVKAPGHDDHHIVIGLSNVDREIRTSGALEILHSNQMSFDGLAHALSIDMESIYYVDIDTDTYLEFKADGPYKRLPMEMTGKNFFEEYSRNLLRLVHDEDREKISAALDKRTMLSILRKHGILAVLYRLIIDGIPVYYRLKAVPASQSDNKHIIIGITNVDSQISDEEHLDTQSHDLITFSGIAQALAADYFSIYVVDTETDNYFEYSSDPKYQQLGIQQYGENFFNLSRKNAKRTIYEEDLPRFLKHFTKNNILKTIRNSGVFLISYRLIIDQQPILVSMKASPFGKENDKRIVIGINNISSGIQLKTNNNIYSNISKALAGDYTNIYYVDLQTDQYIELTTNATRHELNLEKSGAAFFDSIRLNILKTIHPDDREAFDETFRKPRILETLSAGKNFTFNYRQQLKDKYIYLQIKITRLENQNDSHVVVGISDIDEIMRREAQHIEAIRMAKLDSLTGVKSKHTYIEDARIINQDIRAGTAQPFALVFCDLNNLKQINDTYGHAEGDEFIKQACRTICNVYKHSPVYRVGGDEFIIILRGDDYQKRQYLAKMMNALNYAQPVGRKVIIAHGTSDYNSGEDTNLSDVEKRADAEMYKCKKQLKQDLEP